MTVTIYKNEITPEQEEKMNYAISIHEITIVKETTRFYVIFGKENILCSIAGIAD